MKQEIGLDRSSKKFICPGCGKKRFVKYYNYTSDEYFPETYGRCDRELNCGYNRSIKDYYKENPVEYTWVPKTIKFTQPTKLGLNTISNFARNYKQNNFVQFLKSIFQTEIVNIIIKEYLIGTSNHWLGATVFWQVDQNNFVRSGKILLYNQETGRRVKKPYNHINWYHKVFKLPNFNLAQCLFGLHLINEYPNQLISIVESEKTACIMSVLAPQSIWLATGSLHNINSKMFAPLIEREIVLYPDASVKNKNGHSCFDLWSQKAKVLKNQGFKIQVSELVEKKANDEQRVHGFDIADFFIDQLKNKTFSKTQIQSKINATVTLMSTNDRTLNKWRTKNPMIDSLIDEFDLIVS